MRTRHAPALPLIVVACMLAGCSSRRPVQVQTTPGTDFSRYRTYAIRPGNLVYPGASEAQRAQIAQRVQDALAVELEGRGMVPQPDEPELIVTYTVGAQPGDVSGGGGVGRAPVGVDLAGPGGNPYDEPGAVRPQELPDGAADADLRADNVEGDLVIDLIDGRSRRLVWRATAGLELAPTRAPRAIDAAVLRAFAQLPLTRREAPVERLVPVPEEAPASTAPSGENTGR